MVTTCCVKNRIRKSLFFTFKRIQVTYSTRVDKGRILEIEREKRGKPNRKRIQDGGFLPKKMLKILQRLKNISTGMCPNLKGQFLLTCLLSI